MELTNEFRVAVPVDEAWSVLTDVERIAPCLPGAQLQEVEVAREQIALADFILIAFVSGLAAWCTSCIPVGGPAGACCTGRSLELWKSLPCTSRMKTG